jgi:hypothetical protein
VSCPSPLERAFELARSGRFGSVDHISQHLKNEGYDLDQFMGPVLRRQLRQTLDDAVLGAIGRTTTIIPEGYSAHSSAETSKTLPTQQSPGSG